MAVLVCTQVTCASNKQAYIYIYIYMSTKVVRALQSSNARLATRKVPLISYNKPLVSENIDTTISKDGRQQSGISLSTYVCIEVSIYYPVRMRARG